MKTVKLVTGILSMVLTLMILFQSCAAGMSNIIGDTGESSGMAGFLVSLLMIAGGIVQVATRKSKKKGPAIACAVLFFLAALVGFSNAGSFADLNIWSGWCVIMGIINVVSIFVGNKSKDQTPESK